MAILSTYMSDVILFEIKNKNTKICKKVRMDYSCHGRYKDIHIVFSLFSLLSS